LAINDLEDSGHGGQSREYVDDCQYTRP
jgi:hypothetical protein